MSAFEAIAAGARPNFYAMFGEPATISRGAVSVALTGIRSSPGNRLRDVENVATWAEFGEFVVKTADLVGFVPARGDEIAIGSDVWRVASPEGMPETEFIGAEGTELRIYVKLKERT